MQSTNTGNIKKIIMLSHMLFCRRDYERFGIKTLQDNGFEVEYWELVSFLHPKVFCEVKVPDPFQFSGYRKFNDFNELNSAIASLDGACFIISFLSYEPKTFNIYKAISQKKLKYALFIVGSSHPALFFDGVSAVYEAAKGLYRFGKSIMTGELFERYIFPRLPASWLGIKPADLVLACTALNLGAFASSIGKRTELLCIHNLDYDVYLSESKKDNPVDLKTGVFLDEYLSFHPDNVYDGSKPPLRPEEYYPALCRFFDHLEADFGVKIVVAAHPRSHYEEHGDYFGGREVIRGKTAQLVKNAGFVLAHVSTSINYAVLFKKPVILITTDRIKQTALNKFMLRIAKALGKEIINIDHPLKSDWQKELSISEVKYAQYKQYFIKKKGTEELPLWQVVANRVKCY